MIRKWDITNKANKKRCIEEIIARVDEQQGDEFGMLAAQEIIDIVSQFLGPESYNSGVSDAKSLINDKLADIDIDLGILRKSS